MRKRSALHALEADSFQNFLYSQAAIPSQESPLFFKLIWVLAGPDFSFHLAIMSYFS